MSRLEVGRSFMVAGGYFAVLLLLIWFYPIYLTLEEYTYALAAAGYINSSEWLAQLLQSIQPLNYENLFFSHPHHILYGVVLKLFGLTGDPVIALACAQTFNAMLAAGSCWLLYGLARRLRLPVLFAFAAAAGVGFSFGFVRYGTGGEVYLPAVFFILWALYLFYQAPRGGNNQGRVWLLFALAVLCHVLAAVVVAAVGFGYLWQSRLNPAALRRVLKTGLPALAFLLLVIALAAWQSLVPPVKTAGGFSFWDFGWLTDYLFLYFQTAAGEFSLAEFDGWSQLKVSLGLWGTLIFGLDSAAAGLVALLAPALLELSLGHRLAVAPTRRFIFIGGVIFYSLYVFIFWWSYNAFDYYLFLIPIWWLVVMGRLNDLRLSLAAGSAGVAALKTVPLIRENSERLTKKKWEAGYDGGALLQAAADALVAVLPAGESLPGRFLEVRYQGRLRRIGIYYRRTLIAFFLTTGWREGAGPDWQNPLLSLPGLTRLSRRPKVVPALGIGLLALIVFMNSMAGLDYRNRFGLAKVCKAYGTCPGDQANPATDKLFIYDYLSPDVLFFRIAAGALPEQTIPMDLSSIDFNRDFRSPAGHFRLAYEIWLGDLRKVKTYGINVETGKSLYYAWQWAHYKRVLERAAKYAGPVELYTRQLPAGFVTAELKRKNSRFLNRNKKFKLPAPFGLYGKLVEDLAEERPQVMKNDESLPYKSLPRSMRHFTVEPESLDIWHHSFGVSPN